MDKKSDHVSFEMVCFIVKHFLFGLCCTIIQMIVLFVLYYIRLLHQNNLGAAYWMEITFLF